MNSTLFFGYFGPISIFLIVFISNSLLFLKVLYFAPVNEMAHSTLLSAVNVLFKCKLKIEIEQKTLKN
jgi:hypothetical protein